MDSLLACCFTFNSCLLPSTSLGVPKSHAVHMLLVHQPITPRPMYHNTTGQKCNMTILPAPGPSEVKYAGGSADAIEHRELTYSTRLTFDRVGPLLVWHATLDNSNIVCGQGNTCPHVELTFVSHHSLC